MSVAVPPAGAGPAAASARTQTALGLSGEGALSLDRDRKATFSLPWLVASIAHRPAAWVQLYLAAELEQTRHLGLEQAFIEVAPHPAFGVRAGLLLLPLGIINQWHVPTTFLTVQRPLTDLLIIPTAWREVGVGAFGAFGPYVRYQLQVVAGLNAAGFSAEAPLWGGRGNGTVLAAHDAAVVGRVEIGRLASGLTVGGSGYWGGASGGHDQLDRVKVSLAEGDARLRGGGFDLRAEFAEMFIVDSYQVNDYLGLLGQAAVPARGRGFYLQAGYDVLSLSDVSARQELVFFAGYENVNPRTRMSPYNYNPPTITGPGQLAPDAPSPGKSFVRGGVTYRPIPALAFKADVQVALAAEGVASPSSRVTTAQGTPLALPGWLDAAAQGKTLVSLAIAFAF